MSAGSYPAPRVSYLPDELTQWRPAASAFAGWAAREPVLAGLDLPALAATLLDAATSHGRRDDLLGALIRLARDDADAATAVVVCLLPGLRRIARRLACGVDRDDLWAELLSQAYARVRRYDLARRPRRIASNLLLDSMSHTLTWLRREYAWQRVTEPIEAAPPVASPGDGDPLRLAVAFGVVTADDADLIRATRLDGEELRTVATSRGLTYECARKRRQRAESAVVRFLTLDDMRGGGVTPGAQ